MIKIKDGQLKKIVYLLDQAKQGNHIIFGNDLIKKAISAEIPEHKNKLLSQQMEVMLGKSTLNDQKEYFNELDEKDKPYFIRMYLNIIENEVYDDKVIH